MSMTDIVREHARLIILRDLSEQSDRRWNSAFLQEDLDLRWGIKKPREWIHDELAWLGEMGAVTLDKAGSVLIATLTQKGLDHVEMRQIITGVRRPGLGD